MQATQQNKQATDAKALELANKQRAVELRDFLLQRKDALAQVAEKFMTPERMVRLTLAAASRNPEMLKASPNSVLAALMDCARLKLEPCGKGGVWLVPFYNNKTNQMEVQSITDYRGEIALARRSGDIGPISVLPVYKEDDFEYFGGDDERIVHKPNLLFERKNEIDGLFAVYAIAKSKDGSVVMGRKVLPLFEIERARAKSKSKTGPWATDYVAMAMKTAVRRVCNLLPMSSEYREQVEKEEAIDYDPITGTVDIAPEPAKSANDKLRDALNKKKPPEPDPIIDVEVEPADMAPEQQVPPPATEEEKPKAEPEEKADDPMRVLVDLQAAMVQLLDNDHARAKKAWSANLGSLDGMTLEQLRSSIPKAQGVVRKLELAHKARELAADCKELGKPFQGNMPSEAPWEDKVSFLQGVVKELEARKASLQKE